MTKLFLVFSLLLLSFNSFSVENFDASALSQNDRKTFTITDVKVRELGRSDDFSVPPAPPFTLITPPLVLVNPLAEVIMIIDSLLGLGQKIWPIIKAGQPVVTTKFVPAISIIPNIDGTNTTLNQMENWSKPRMVSYRISFTNAFNMEVIGFTYTIFFQHHGTYAGKGQYVTNLKVQASNITASWGSTFDASSELIGISNVGTLESPIASGIIQVAYIAKGLLNQSSGARSFYVDGAGGLASINE